MGSCCHCQHFTPKVQADRAFRLKAALLEKALTSSDILAAEQSAVQERSSRYRSMSSAHTVPFSDLPQHRARSPILVSDQRSASKPPPKKAKSKLKHKTPRPSQHKDPELSPFHCLLRNRLSYLRKTSCIATTSDTFLPSEGTGRLRFEVDIPARQTQHPSPKKHCLGHPHQPQLMP